jgi:hypothetical protein
MHNPNRSTGRTQARAGELYVGRQEGGIKDYGPGDRYQEGDGCRC